MKRLLPIGLISIGAVLLLWNLGRPALWQDEAETALRAESILETGLPHMSLRGILVTTQHSLSRHEGNADGVWTWNTWLPAYLVAFSFSILGRTPFAARLPFALAGIIALWLSWRLFCDGEDDVPIERRAWASEAALALLTLSPAFLLFCRQSRYYGLLPLGTVLVLHSWRRLLAGKPWGVPAVALSLQFLLHASFGLFTCACLTLALDAVLRRDECWRAGRFWAAATLTLALSAPVVWYFRIWDRPGNHSYGFQESLEFLKTFLLWLAAFAMPFFLVVAVFVRRRSLVALGVALLCGLVAEGPWSRLCAVAVWSSLFALAVQRPSSRGAMDLERLCLLSLVATLALLSFGAAEPYGRYLAGFLPVLAYLAARGFSMLGRGRAPAVAGLALLAVGSNLFFVLPLKAAQALIPAKPAASVSGMMRQRLRDLPLRSDLRAYSSEIFRGPEGYIETAAASMNAGGGRDYFSDADDLSLMFATGLRPLTPGEFLSKEPDWLMPSPWIQLTPSLDSRMRQLLASGRYEQVAAQAPRLMWQNNPDPLFHDFMPSRGVLRLFRRR